MIAIVGYLGLVVALFAALGGISATISGLTTHDGRRLKTVVNWSALLFLGLAMSVLMMEVALLSDDFSLVYVADNSTRATPTPYKMATLWGALEGSLLLWAFVLALFVVGVTWRFRDRLDDRLTGFAMLTLFSVSAFFLALLALLANPFATGEAPLDGSGLNPLLRNHPLMVIHPLMLYLGYVGFTVPFAFAIGALATGRVGEGWLAATRTWTLVAWGCLTMGIVLGSWWSYEVLGWGGYWSWDPVENASFMPWLTGTAYIHSVMVQERRGLLRVWNLSLLLATFGLTIFGTFLTRSGVISSVHAFADGAVGPALFALVAVVCLVSLGLLWWRADRLHSPGSIDQPVSREGVFLANNLLFVCFALIVLIGTLFPMLYELFANDEINVGPPFFDGMLMPIGLALLLLMGLAPMLTWRSTSRALLRERVLIPAWMGVAAMVVGVLAGGNGFVPIIGIGLAGFTIGGAVRHLFLAGRRNGWRGLVGRAGGGMVAHIGLGLVAFGLIASSAFSSQGEFRLEPGDTATVAGHTVTFLSLEVEEGPDSVATKARVHVEGRGIHEPAVTQFFTFGTPIQTPSVAVSAVDDVFLSFAATPEQDDDAIVLRVVIQPLVVWLWIGGLVMALGTALALIPGRRNERQPGLDRDVVTNAASA